MKYDESMWTMQRPSDVKPSPYLEAAALLDALSGVPDVYAARDRAIEAICYWVVREFAEEVVEK